jgi:hypothetical protein
MEKAPLIEALCKATLEFDPIVKDENAKVKTKSGSEYGYSYASLDMIILATRKALASNGLNITHYTEEREGKTWLITELRHSSGCLPDKTESCIDKFTADSYMSVIQNFGSIITYLKRYHIAMLLNVAIDEDDDGKAKDMGKKNVPSGQKTDQPDNLANSENTETGTLDKISEIEINAILEACKKAGLDTEKQALNKVISVLKGNYRTLADLTMTEYATVMATFDTTKNGNRADMDKQKRRAFAISAKLLMSDEEISADILKHFGYQTRKDMTEPQWQQYADMLLIYEKNMVTDEQIERMKALPKPYKELTLPNFLEFVNSNLRVAKLKTHDIDKKPIEHIDINNVEQLKEWEADYIIRVLSTLSEQGT